ncbi:thymidylate synthase [Chitinophaga sp. W3I9]|uniref:hypothetical protein n=1 Tax=Chitinophaga sp. W3I9 TaxID=3373924 RepID=UPI003D1BD96C
MNNPYIIEGKNLSETWLTAMTKIIESSGKEITPLVLTMTDFGESQTFRQHLNSDLHSRDLDSVETVSETIFPDSLYKLCKNNRSELYKLYLRSLPRIRKVDRRNNKGIYFERLIRYDDDKQVNQLEMIINSLSNTSVRRSKLQASTFDPNRDYTDSPYQSFPCLQHITFYKSESGGLILNSFYAIQYLYQRAYGNWLGLINLGKFVAQESNLKFERFNCFIGVEQLDPKITKSDAKLILSKLS